MSPLIPQASQPAYARIRWVGRGAYDFTPQTCSWQIPVQPSIRMMYYNPDPLASTPRAYQAIVTHKTRPMNAPVPYQRCRIASIFEGGTVGLVPSTVRGTRWVPCISLYEETRDKIETKETLEA